MIVEASIDDSGGISPTGSYEFGGAAGSSFLDLGAVFSVDFKRHFLTEGFFPSDLFDARGLIDDITDFDGTTALDVNAEMQISVTQDNPGSGSPTYTAFQTFANGTYKGRGFKFKANLISNDIGQDIKVSQLGYTASLQRRTEQGNLTASGAGAKAVTLLIRFLLVHLLFLEQILIYPRLVLMHRIWHQEITLKCLVYLERVLLFTLKIHQMLRLIEILPIRLSDLVKEGRIGSMLLKFKWQNTIL